MFLHISLHTYKVCMPLDQGQVLLLAMWATARDACLRRPEKKVFCMIAPADPQIWPDHITSQPLLARFGPVMPHPGPQFFQIFEAFGHCNVATFLYIYYLYLTVLLCSNRSDLSTPPTYLSYAATAVRVGTEFTEASHHLLSFGRALCPKCTQDRRLYRWRLPWCPSTSQTSVHYLISTPSSLLATFCAGHFYCQENCHSKGCSLGSGCLYYLLTPSHYRRACSLI